MLQAAAAKALFCFLDAPDIHGKGSGNPFVMYCIEQCLEVQQQIEGMQPSPEKTLLSHQLEAQVGCTFLFLLANASDSKYEGWRNAYRLKMLEFEAKLNAFEAMKKLCARGVELDFIGSQKTIFVTAQVKCPWKEDKFDEVISNPEVPSIITAAELRRSSQIRVWMCTFCRYFQRAHAVVPGGTRASRRASLL